jgi:hypothetical protein
MAQHVAITTDRPRLDADFPGFVPFHPASSQQLPPATFGVNAGTPPRRRAALAVTPTSISATSSDSSARRRRRRGISSIPSADTESPLRSSTQQALQPEALLSVPFDSAAQFDEAGVRLPYDNARARALNEITSIPDGGRAALSMFAPEDKGVVRGAGHELILRTCTQDNCPLLKHAFATGAWEVVARRHYDAGGAKISINEHAVRVVCGLSPCQKAARLIFGVLVDECPCGCFPRGSG